jgi:hypothetical protein
VELVPLARAPAAARPARAAVLARAVTGLAAGAAEGTGFAAPDPGRRARRDPRRPRGDTTMIEGWLDGPAGWVTRLGPKPGRRP